MDRGKDGKEFGQRIPPLYVTIKQILERYPDGQIFKEMIQNADDAGATVVQFYVDCRQHGTSDLVIPELAAYQGPALISANDAMFSEQDWDGIQRLQQSMKADNPFKVGHFGIGFNSVYHLTDLPSIISGGRIAYLEPQGEIWKGSGRSYELSELVGTDCLKSLDKVANFDFQTACYNKTLLRFPLRCKSSKLSENLYSVKKVNELTEALKLEAKFLLLFLHSIHTIEVYNIDHSGRQTLSFQTKISDASVADLKQRRRKLLDDLKSSHSLQQYDFPDVIKFNAKLDVCVYDANTSCTSTSHWLVANQVGSSSPTVRAAAVKQKVFPWVGTAVEIDSPGNGRIFCFLPMPIESASNLPVHVNGTFGLNDDRRSLKWPGVERRNDLMADWNKMLVTEVIPACYVSLLLESKSCFKGSDFYEAWPKVSSLQNTQWEPLLSEVFSAIMSHAVILSKHIGKWIKPATAVFVPRDEALVPVVEHVLTKCGVQLAEVPQSVRDAFAWVGISMTEVNPKLARQYLRGNSSSYSSLSAADKYALLVYCLLDGSYSDLSGLWLLPLCNGEFQAFQTPATSTVYLCREECPRSLLPNSDHKLVDFTSNSTLQNVLVKVAKSGYTQLKELAIPDMPTLISEGMPAEWRNLKVVSFPSTTNLPPQWFEQFWSWVKNKQLSAFDDNFILPVLKEDVSAPGHFNVVKLKTQQPILYIPEGSTCSELATCMTILRKFRILCCVQKLQDFSFITHTELSKYTNSFDSNGILKSVSSFPGYPNVTLTSDEAACMRKLLCNTHISSEYHHVLCGLRIFTSDTNSNGHLYSVKDACHESILKTAITLENSSKQFNVSVLPADVILFTSGEHYQKKLLQIVTSDSFMSEVAFLTTHIFPCIQNWTIPEKSVTPIMIEVLGKFDVLKHHDPSIPETLKKLSFVVCSSGAHKCPKDLYDPDIAELHLIFYDAPVFPTVPYDKPQHVSALRHCGLRASIGPQEILDTIVKIGTPAQATPQSVNAKKFVCAKAILKYIGANRYQSSYISCSLPKNINSDSLPFSPALNLLSSNKCWLPVLANRPPDYPSCLPWKGETFTSHLCCLCSNVCISSASTASHPLMYGSQVYFTDPALESDILTSQVHPSHLVAHLKEVVGCAQHFKQAQLFDTVQAIYSAMTGIVRRGEASGLSSLQSVAKWIYLKDHNKFISPDTVALHENPSFRHNLEPYLHKLPDSISNFSKLFTAFGVSEEMSKSHIISVLSAMREDIVNDVMSISVDESWSVVMAILNWLTENGTTDYHGCLDSLYIPTESDSQWPNLKPASKVVYTDNEFFKKFTMDSEKESLQFLHSRASVTIAECLQLTPLSKELDIAGDTFEDTGQYEPLTTRLKNILRDYKDGLTIVKELIQNADDAEATEVNICFDGRTHCQDTGKLFFPGMAKSHGPALVIHNNTVFSDEDFENITKLAGATKQEKHLKIGKFGIGFCSVYHITDIPSFVSRDRLYIFDPTLAHFGKEIKNPALPGKKLQFTSRIIQNSKQLDPYDDLYQFNRTGSYSGTMFRLPFRTSASELSGKCYTEATALELLDDIYKCSESLILFLQHIQTITYQRITNSERQPTTLFTVCRKDFSFMHTIAQPGISTISIESEKGSNAKSSKWLVSQHSTYSGDKYAVASIACELSSDSTKKYSVNELLRGEVFCFLPLSQSTGLPAHVSCNFAVINNRRGIWTADESASTADEAEVGWNIFLMENVIPKAYLGLLHAIKKMHELDVLDMYDFYDLWPQLGDLVQYNPWSKFVWKLYEELSSAALFYCNSQKEWKSLKQSHFLQPKILSISEPQILKCFTDILTHLGIPMVELPVKYHANFDHPFKDAVINEEGFIKIFFSKISQLTAIQESRNAVIQAILEIYAAECDNHSNISLVLQKFMGQQACIPCSPDGQKLKICSKLIHPRAEFAKLYDAEEGMFPSEELMKRSLPEVAMKNLGLIHTSIPWENVVERAKTVQALMKSDSDRAYHRIKYIIEAITSHTSNTQPNFVLSIGSIKFLPVMRRPDDYPLQWLGDESTLRSGDEMVMSGLNRSNIILAGSQWIFVCENEPFNQGCGFISPRAREVLGLKAFPSLESVIEHFIVIISEASVLSTDCIDDSCRQIYTHLEKNLKSAQPSPLFNKLSDLACIWTGTRFIHASEVSFRWSLNGPYLFKVPSRLPSKKLLCGVLGIKDVFSVENIKSALEKMRTDFEDTPVDSDCQMVLQQLVPLLQNRQDESLKDYDLHIPDGNFCLHRSSDLAYNDAPWAPPDESHIYVNDIIPRSLAQNLGVRPVRSRFLDKYSSVHNFKGGVAFGQREILTRRIQNILRDYPLDVTLLKELLQNADDAKATKMYVVLDQRFHKTTSILSEEWADLQGPAMLVWNDSVFSEEDLEGIQELGLGSKRSEVDTIGQYGIGFNVVYHITDCPSFVSNGETLCIMDPHCRYAPGANELSPGRRFDRLNDGFWKDFPDMQSAYLRGGVSNMPSDMLKGSLFRFPIRHEKRNIAKSEIVDGIESSKSSLNAKELDIYLRSWMEKMKKAMLFLNNISELKLFTIEEGKSEIRTVYHFQSQISESALADRQTLQEALSAYKSIRGSRSCVVMYPLIVTGVSTSSQEKDTVEKWLIQQGIGDIHDESHNWKYISSVKPRHGIAAPQFIAEKKGEFKGQVFCFLPLPVQSGFPVHLNGHFILNSTRRELWRSTDVDITDSRSQWNDNLCTALASSYADFLVRARSHYVLEEYKTMRTAVDAIEKFYALFPIFSEQKTYWNVLAQDVCKSIIQHNLPVFCTIETKANTEGCTTKWYPPKSNTPADQIYYWSSSNYTYDMHKKVYPVLERVGMNITPAPSKVIECFNTAMKELAVGAKFYYASTKSIFYYYTKISTFASHSMQPTKIDSTAFQNVESYLTFTKYILQNEPQNPNMSASFFQKHDIPQVYPEPPYGHFLLLTADSMLRKYDNTSKVLMSHFSDLFPDSPSCFLHPHLLEACFTKSYFIQPQDKNETTILRIIEENLPVELKSVAVVLDASSVISRDRLFSLWKCFAKDHVFTKRIEDILAQWALLLSQDNRVFSKLSDIQPVLGEYSYVSSQKNMWKVAKKIGMPFLDSSVVVATVDCPSLSDGKRILFNMYHVNKETPLKSKLDITELNNIITYLESVEVMSDSSLEVIEQVISLPLFENIDGNYTSLTDYGAAYVWPDGACEIAYQKWLEGHSAVFIKSRGRWSELGGAQKLSIGVISTEELYHMYIFHHFCKMNSAERHQHLEYIRDHLHRTMNFYSKLQLQSKSSKSQRELHERAVNFIHSLKKLKCIGEDGALHQVSDYCDHSVEILRVFPKHFLFLPDEYRCTSDEEWLPFFRDLGLKQGVTQQEFLEFCRETATGRSVSGVELKDCSRVLLEFLFSRGHEWGCTFLSQVSEIAFVFQAPLPKLSWVLPTVFPVDKMVMLKGSAPFFRASVLWTVKPIVNLPADPSKAIINGLGITSDPNSADVIKNMQNISEKTQYAQLSLFDKYPDHLVCQKGKTTLLHIMAQNFAYLNRAHAKMVADYELASLASLPCMPVYDRTGSDADINKVVLVKPCQVVHAEWNEAQVKKFHPLLHCLPNELNSIPDVLKHLGIKASLELHHIQIVLEGAYEASKDFELDINTEKRVKLAIQYLQKFLEPYQHELDKAGPLLSPLYLPDSENKLRPSKSLVYGDSINYWGEITLDLKGVPYFHFDIKVADYEVDAPVFCNMLPEVVRPIGLSTVCKQMVLDSSKEVANSKVAEQLLATVKFEEIPAGIVSFLNRFVGKQDNEQDLKEVLRRFFSTIEVVTVEDLRIQIALIEFRKTIGTKNTSFCFVPGETQSKLYLDSSLSYPVDDDDAYSEVAQHLCNILCQNMKANLTADRKKREIAKLIKMCLKSASVAQIEKVLSGYGVKLDGQMHGFLKKLGEIVPDCWHHRLDQDIDNVFNPMEYVGYEVKEGHIIIAQIVHPVVADDETPKFERKYRIYVKEDDKEGIDVNILSLYKFLVGCRKPRIQPVPEESEEQAVALFDEGGQLPKLRQNIIEEDLLGIMKKLCTHLKEIWKLPEDLRKKAIRRLFLKWHPDKHDNPEWAEKVFKFMMKQIEHLEKGEPLDDPEDDVKAPSTGGPSYFSRPRRGGRRRYNYRGWDSHSSWFNFKQWSDTAHQQGSSSDFEDSFFGGGGEGGGSSSTRSEYYPFDDEREEKDPEEGHRWVKQAEAEFKVLMVVHSQLSACSGYGSVCFMAHQVVEKALKGGVYALCGMDGRSLIDHNLSRHAQALQAEKPEETLGLADHTIPLEDYYLKTRYPNQWKGYTDIPFDHYIQEDADQAKDHAKAVLDIVNSVMPPVED